MKLFSSDIEMKIKDAFKANRNNIIFALILITVMNVCSGYVVKKSATVMAEAAQLMEEIKKEEEDEKKEIATITQEEENTEDEEEVTNIDESIKVMSKAAILNTMNNIDGKTLEVLAKRLNEYFKVTQSNLSKAKLLEAIVDETIKEMASKDIYLVDDASSKIDEGITIDNFDTVSIEEKLAYICEKYNLTEFEFKVVISVLYHEAGWYYDDAFKVATVIYNRTKSKESIRYTHYLTKLDGESMYSQVIATNYTKDGKKVQQFDGYLPDKAGYDYDSLLKSDPELVKLNGLLDCLILLKLGEDYENPAFPLAPCFSNINFWGDGRRNHFSGPMAANDVVDNYSFPDKEYNDEFTREDIINMAKEYSKSAKKRVK